MADRYGNKNNPFKWVKTILRLVLIIQIAIAIINLFVFVNVISYQSTIVGAIPLLHLVECNSNFSAFDVIEVINRLQSNSRSNTYEFKLAICDR